MTGTMQARFDIAGIAAPARWRFTDHVLLAAVVVAAAALAWIWLLAAPSALQGAICGGGTGSGVASLAMMWLAMNAAMMLPVAIGPILRARQAKSPAPFAFVAAFGATVVAIGVAGAFAQWVIEAAGSPGGPGTGSAIAAAGLILLGSYHALCPSVSKRAECGPMAGSRLEPHAPTARRGLKLGCASLRCCLVMLSVQFFAGTVGTMAMAGLMLWMALESLLPWKRRLSTLTGSALAMAGGLSLVHSIL